MTEQHEWVLAFQQFCHQHGWPEGGQLLAHLRATMQRHGHTPDASTPYSNTLAPAVYPGIAEHEDAIDAWLRWNAMAMVVRAGRAFPELGGHLATFASCATLYAVGFHHIWRANHPDRPGDLLFFQGHASPGIYAYAYLLGDLSDHHLHHFRQETPPQKGLSSYPHPWLMPNFWQFPTVSMGLGPLQGIYQARFMQYLHDRQLVPLNQRHVWVFCGDGEMDEPESTGALHLAGYERLRHLTFVINCNLQRLDGPVRSNGNIIQILESTFAGAGWHVIKIIWPPVLQAWLDQHPSVSERLGTLVDGAFQTLATLPPQALALALADGNETLAQQIHAVLGQDACFGGHFVEPIHTAYRAALTADKPTVILIKTIKGYGLGAATHGQNTAHQQKKLTDEMILAYRDRLHLPLSDADAIALSFYRPPDDHPAQRYLQHHRQKLGGALTVRHSTHQPLPLPPDTLFELFHHGSAEKKLSTTMVFVRLLQALMRSDMGKWVVPIVPDECRTFGMEGLFRTFGIYSHRGQLYEPVDKGQLAYYCEKTDGQIIQEGITEAGAFASWLAAATAYSVHHQPCMPFYVYYSMFGHQRIFDLCWLAADARARGFLLGATAGRTTLAGEGLQHQDGHSLVMAAMIPNCKSYDPAFAYELAVIMKAGLHEMQTQDVHYYITLMNENYTHPPMPANSEPGILKGLYGYTQHDNALMQLVGSGAILNEVISAAEWLKTKHLPVNVWSATSFSELARDGMQCERAQRAGQADHVPYVTRCFQQQSGFILVVTDYIRAHAETIRAYCPLPYHTLGTDGFGRSDTRQALRHFFEVSASAIIDTTLFYMMQHHVITHEHGTALRAELSFTYANTPPWQT
jgi:pyruvate dehydrogenase E1 component